MKAQRVWVCLGGGLCLTAAMIVQRGWGQQNPGVPPIPPPPSIPSAPPESAPISPPISVPSRLISSAEAPIGPAPLVPQAVNAPMPPQLTSSVPPAIPAAPQGSTILIPPHTAENRIFEITPPPSQATSQRIHEPVHREPRHGQHEQTITIEWVGAASARLNLPATYQIVVRNGGPTPVNQVIVKPNLPEGAVIKSSDPVLPQTADAGWNVGTLAPGQTRKIEVVIQSSKRGHQNYSATAFFAASATHMTEVREPLLQIKMKMPEKGLVGESAPIQFTISNPGDGATENIKVRAILPEGLEHPLGQTFEIPAGSLAPKETRTLQLACMAKGHGSMKATLIASADGELSATDVGSFEVVTPRLDIVLNGPKLRFVDRPARYTMKVSNPGNAPAQAVVLNELVPAGFRFAAASNQGQYDEINRTVSWQIGDLAPGQSRELSVDLIPTVPGDHRLAALVQSSRGIRNESAIQTRVEGLSNVVLEVSNADNPVEIGSDSTYEIRLANAGTKVETNLLVVCTLSDSVEFRDAKNSAGARVRREKNDLIFEPLPRLAPRGEVIYRVTVKGRLPGDVRFRARVQAEGMADAIIREETTKFYDDNVVR